MRQLALLITTSTIIIRIITIFSLTMTNATTTIANNYNVHSYLPLLPTLALLQLLAQHPTPLFLNTMITNTIIIHSLTPPPLSPSPTLLNTITIATTPTTAAACISINYNGSSRTSSGDGGGCGGGDNGGGGGCNSGGSNHVW